MLMTEQICLDTADQAEARDHLAQQLGRDALNDTDFALLLYALQAKAGPYEVVEFPSPRRALGVRVKNSNYNINVQNATVLGAAVVLDALATAGLASAALAALGRDLRVIARLPCESGLLCNYILLESVVAKNELPKSASELAALISGNACPYPECRCRHKSEQTCSITTQGMTENIVTLEQHAVVKLDDDNSVARIY
jgi:hypothetical protein